jgi:transcriptional regulator with XRE-family HTH domain
MIKIVFLSPFRSQDQEVRRKKLVTQKETAILCNLEEANISRIESGKTNTTILTLVKISTVLGINMTELLMSNEERSRRKPASIMKKYGMKDKSIRNLSCSGN